MKKLALIIGTLLLSITVTIPALAQVQTAMAPAKAATTAPEAAVAAKTQPTKPAAPVKAAPVKAAPAMVKKAAPAKVSQPKADKPQPKKDMREFYLIAIMVIMGAAVVGGTLSLALVGAKVVSGVVRNPGARPAVMPLLLLSMALIESVVIYGLVVTVLLYAKL